MRHLNKFAIGAVLAISSSMSVVSADAVHRYVFAPSFASNIVSVFDLDTNAVAALIPADAKGPCCAYTTPDQTTVFIVDGLSPYVSVIDVATLRVTKRILLKGTLGDRGTAIQRDGKLFWVSTIPEGNIEAIDVATEEIVRTFPLVSNTYTISRDGATLYTANLTTLPTGIASTAMTFASRSPVTGQVLGTVSLPVSIDSPPLQMYATFDDSKVYVQMLGPHGVVHVVDVRDRTKPRYVKTLHVGAVPIVGAFTPDGTQLWFPNSGDGTVTVLDTATDTIIRVIDFGQYVAGVSILGDRAYVSISPGVIPIPLLSEVLLFAGLIPGAAITPGSGSTSHRPLIELPGEIHVFDRHTYQELPIAPMKLPSVSQVMDVAANGG